MATTGGSSFFPDQQRLLEVVLATRALAHEVGADLSSLLPEELIERTLCRQRGLMVLGAVNAGKSTLINALCGAPLCPVSKLPETKRITIHLTDQDSPGFPIPAPAESARHADVPTLRDFIFIDTPGAGTLTPDRHACILDLAIACDFLLVVLPVTNPWEPAIWDVIAQLPENEYPKLLFILQQADLRPQEDIAVLIGHVADLTRKRCGITPPVFPFSAPGHITRPDGTLLPDCSAIWQHVTTSIRNGDSYRNHLGDCKNRAAKALRLLDDHIDLTHRELGHKNQLLDEIDHDIGLMHASFRRQLESRMDELAASFRMGNDDTQRILRKRLRILPSLLRLFGKDQTAATVETAFVERLKSTFQNIGKEDAMAILSSCRNHARSVDARLREQGLSLPLSETDLDSHLAQAELRFREKLDQAAGVRLESVRVRNRLVKELRRRNRALTAFTASCLLFLTLGSVAGAIGVTWAAYSLCAISLLFLCGGLLTSTQTTPRVLEVFDGQMSEACGAFAKALWTDYEDALHRVFRDYSETMLPLRSKLSHTESSVKPLQKRWQELYLRLKALE